MTPQLEPPYIPPWWGRDPVRYWIAPEMRRFQAEIEMALLTFTRERMADGRALRLRFQEISAPQQSRSIDFRLEPLNGLLALGFYPPPLNQEPQSGDVTMNSTVDWNHPACRPLVLPLLIHELAAHSLGLGHLYLPESVRFPLVSAGKVNLAPMDRQALVTIYGA